MAVTRAATRTMLWRVRAVFARPVTPRAQTLFKRRRLVSTPSVAVTRGPSSHAAIAYATVSQNGKSNLT
jgi:hypothetical protein